MSDRKRRRMHAGLVLIAVGLGLFLLDRFEGIGDEAILLVIGSAFLIGYFVQKRYGLLIPAGVLLGLGAGGAVDRRLNDYGDPTVIGLGAGFVAIFLISRIYEGKAHWWPLIPGGVLLAVGIPQGERLFDWALDNWQLILVAVGVLLLIGAWRGGRE